MKQIKKITTTALCMLLACSLSVTAFAASSPSEKEEVIYVMADASGKVTDIEAVNIFKGGNITDYGDYEAVKILNTNDSITQKGEKITFSSSADKVYYQGTMKTTDIPWNISIKYYLDKKEYSADELAGKSGALEIRFVVSENNNFKGNFYDDYALQASFTLDTALCKNIVASGATVANVGSDKQLTYTILPGKGIDTSICADVTDFEMDAASINAVRLNMDLEVDDSELMDKVDEISSSAYDLNEGADELNDGTKTLYDATKTLSSKVSELNDGVGTLSNGSNDLYLGLVNITSKSDQLTLAAYTAYEGVCSAASAALNAQLKENNIASVTLTPSNYSDVLLELLAMMDADVVYNQAYESALSKVTEQVEAKADDLYQGYIKSQENSIYLSYVSSLADELYTKAATQSVYEQLIKNSYTEEEATAYLQTKEGQSAIAKATESLTDEQKSAILSSAVSQLFDEQKAQILEGALQSLSDEQKTQIKDSYIQQMMGSDDVTSQINSAVTEVSEAAFAVSELKGQLDNYGAFYQGLLDYTDAVADASTGAGSLNQNTDTLYSSTGTLNSSVGELSDAAKKLYDGTGSLKDGTSEFSEKTSDIDTQVSEQIDSMISSVTGSDDETVSFVSEKNTNVSSVQFVIKTAAIEKPEINVTETKEEESFTFWQKLLRLFGL